PMMARRPRGSHVIGTSWQRRSGRASSGMTNIAAPPRLVRSVLVLAVLLLAAGGTIRAQDAPDAPAPDAKTAARPETADPGYLERRWAGTDLTALATALGAYRRDHGQWPAHCPGDAAAMLSPAPEKDPWGSAYACVLDEPA